MKNFDEARSKRPLRTEEERTFVLGGETFVLRQSVRPDKLMLAGSTEGREPLELLENADAAIVACIEPEYRDEYVKLRGREDDPVTLEDVLDVVVWAIEAQTSRPTEASASSSNGPTSTGTILTGVSSSPAARAEPTP